jgi:hypothetical protein
MIAFTIHRGSPPNARRMAISFRPEHHGIRKQSADPDRRQQQRCTAENTGEQRREAIQPQGRGERIAEALELEDEVGSRGCHRLLNRRLLNWPADDERTAAGRLAWAM